MTRKELIEKLLAVGNDDSEVRDLFDSDTFGIIDVKAGRDNPSFDGEEDSDQPEYIDEDTIFLTVENG